MIRPLALKLLLLDTYTTFLFSMAPNLPSNLCLQLPLRIFSKGNGALRKALEVNNSPRALLDGPGSSIRDC